MLMIKIILKKYRSFPVTVRAVFWFTICNLIIKGIGFISSFIFTRMMPQDQYGILSLFISYEHIILVLATWEIQLGAYTRGLFKYKENNLETFTSSMLLLTNVLTIIFFGILFIFRTPFTSFTGIGEPIMLIMCISFIFNPGYTAWITRKRIHYDYKPAVIATVLFAVLNVAVPVIVLLFTPRTANVKYISTLIVSAIFWFLFWVKSAKYNTLLKNKENVKEYWKFMLAYEAPLVVHSLSYFVLNQADRIMIGRMVGNEETALYSVAYSIAFIVTILQTSLDQVLQPWRYHKLDAKEYRRIGSISNSILIIYGGLIALFILVAPEIMRIFYPASYYDGIWCIPPVATGAFFMFLYSLFVGVESYYEKTKYVLYVSLACGTINIILNYFGILSFGYIACAYTTLICYILFAVGHYFFMKRTLKLSGVNESIYNIKTILIIGVGVLVVSILFTLIYPYIIVRYVLIALIGLIGYINRDKIVKLYKDLKNKT